MDVRYIDSHGGVQQSGRTARLQHYSTTDQRSGRMARAEHQSWLRRELAVV